MILFILFISYSTVVSKYTFTSIKAALNSKNLNNNTSNREYVQMYNVL